MAARPVLLRSISFVAGGYVADGAAMEKAIKDLVDLGKMGRISRRSSSTSAHGGVALHSLSHAIPEAKPKPASCSARSCK